MSVQFDEKDLGWKAFVNEVKKLDKNPYTKIGIQQDENHPEDGESLLIIASSNEFGTHDGRIPERSYMRSTHDENKRLITSMVDRGYDSIIAGKSTVKTVLSQIGAVFKGEVQKKMVDLTSPPNAESTIKRKGSSNPLIDTGFLRQSIKDKVVMEGDK